MAKVEAASQGVDKDFNFTGSYDSIEFGKVALTKARELVRELPDEGGVSQAYLDGEGDLCPPCIHLTFKKMVKKGFVRKREVEEPVVLTLIGGNEKGKVQISPFGDINFPQGKVSFSEGDEVIRDFFDRAALEPAFPAGL